MLGPGIAQTLLTRLPPGAPSLARLCSCAKGGRARTFPILANYLRQLCRLFRRVPHPFGVLCRKGGIARTSPHPPTRLPQSGTNWPPPALANYSRQLCRLFRAFCHTRNRQERNGPPARRQFPSVKPVPRQNQRVSGAIPPPPPLTLPRNKQATRIKSITCKFSLSKNSLKIAFF
jgi:hypothetical protein